MLGHEAADLGGRTRGAGAEPVKARLQAGDPFRLPADGLGLTDQLIRLAVDRLPAGHERRDDRRERGGDHSGDRPGRRRPCSAGT